MALNQADPPQRQLPAEAVKPCGLYILPSKGALAGSDLEIAYIIRGAQVVKCDSARGLAVLVHEGEHADELEWKRARIKRNCPWWRIFGCN